MDETLLPRLRALFPERDSADWDIFDFLSAEGTLTLTLLYARLFWPDFVVVDDMVFLKEHMATPDQLRHLEEGKRKHGGDRRKIEEAFNLVEDEWFIAAEHDGGTDEETEAEYRWLLERMAEMWRCRLALLFPQRRFTVEVFDYEDERGLTFYQS